MDNNTEQLKVLAEVFNTDKIITSDQIEQVLTGILGLLVRFKKENQSLNNDTKTQVESILESISKEHDRILKSVENSTQNVKSEATESITKAISEMKRMCAEVMEMKPKDGEKGEDADEEKIIEEVLAKIKLPEYKEVVLDDGSEIIAKINDEKVAKINASQIEGLPTFGGKPNGGGWRNLNQLHDVNLSNLANNDVLKYNSTTELWENGATSGTGTVTSVAATVPTGLTISGSPVTTSGTLAIGLDTGYVIPLQTTLDGKASTGAVTGTGITMSTARILGRTTAATGAIEELTAGSSLSLSAGSLDTIQDIRTTANPQFATIELGAATDTTLSRVSAGVIAVEGVTIATASNTLTLSNKSVSGALNLEENASIALDPAASADGKYTGITRTGTAGAALAFGDLVYLDPTDSRWELADANAAQGADGDSRGVLGICVLAAAADGDPTTILLYGTVRADTAFPTMTVNNQMYVSETAGDITGTQPTTTDVVIRVVGAALSADELLFNPSPDYITHT